MKGLIKLSGLFLMIGIACSCSDIRFGDDFLGTAPESNETTLDSMFSSKINAERVLTQAYTYLPYGLPTGGAPNNKLGGNVLESITDLCSSNRENASDGPWGLYYNGALTPTSVNTNANYCFGSENDWKAIRYAWFYIENVKRVPDMSEEEKQERIAEAKIIIAISYSEMLKYIGGFPYLDHAIEPSEKMEFPRLTFAQSVEKIITLIDEAMPYLKWSFNGNDNGRMTQAGALALKLRVQLFAASPTFNSDTKWHPDADEYTCYGKYDRTLWENAKATADVLLGKLKDYGVYGLEMPVSNSTENRRAAYRKAYYNRDSKEVLISIRRGADHTAHDAMINTAYFWGPTLNYVDMFSWIDGTDFPKDFNWENPSKAPFFDEEGRATRDLRLYETVAVPGDIYMNGTLAPVYENAINGFQKNGTGFRMMKFILQQESDRSSVRAHWPYIRLAEVYLNYAEILNHLNGGPGRTSDGKNPADYFNMVHTRLGLPAVDVSGMSEEGFNAMLMRERALEFGFEEVRWFDLVRYGMQNEFTKKLYKLVSRGNTDINPTSYTFKKMELTGYDRSWQTNFDTKWYLAPIPLQEVNKNYGMTQNPGW